MHAELTSPDPSLLMDQCRALLAARDLHGALAKLDEAIAAYQQRQMVVGEPIAIAWLTKANLTRDLKLGIARAREAYQQGIQALPDPWGEHAVNLKANLWTNLGIAVMEQATGSDSTEAVECFDAAIQLRAGLPMERSPRLPWGLSASWLNRADALARADSKLHHQEILRSLDEAVRILETMKPTDHPSVSARIALAWMNRGTLVAASGGDVEEALRCLNQSIAACENAPPQGVEECRRVLLGALLNRANLLQRKEPLKAREDCQRVITLTTDLEKREPLAAEAGLKARHLLCQVLTQLPPNATDDWVTEATDAVDEGMALARFWQQHGEARLEIVSRELFRFGLIVYRVWQPHFLSEFILDHLDPTHSAGAPVQDESSHHLAVDALWSAVEAVNAQAKSSTPERRDKLLALVEDLQATETRLSELRIQHLQPSAS
jgi:tetratricopeptide (TPR) repeat protein